MRISIVIFVIYVIIYLNLKNGYNRICRFYLLINSVLFVVFIKIIKFCKDYKIDFDFKWI